MFNRKPEHFNTIDTIVRHFCVCGCLDLEAEDRRSYFLIGLGMFKYAGAAGAAAATATVAGAVG